MNLQVLGDLFEDVAGIKATDDNGDTVVFEAGGGDPNEALVSLLNGTMQTLNCDVIILKQPVRSNSFLKHIFLPLCTTLNTDDLFYELKGLIDAVFPALKTITGSRHFYGCNKLESVDIGGGTIPGVFLSSCSKLKTLVIRKSTVASLSHTNAFTSTPFASSGSGGTLYVPASLISSYQGASNWSTILGYANNQIKSIESTHTDPTATIDLTLYYADGTPIPTT